AERVGFVNSIARICRQIQRSGGGARPPGSARAIVARRLSRQFALPSDADAKRARDIWDLAIPFLRRTARRGEGLHLQPEALSLFRPRWSERSARDGRLFAARERDAASKVAARCAFDRDRDRAFPARRACQIHWPGRHDLPANRPGPSLRTLRASAPPDPAPARRRSDLACSR